MSASARQECPRTEAELERRLSEPTAEVQATLEALPGDVIVLGAGGKMGPTTARMLRRAADRAGGVRRIVAVSRFGSPGLATALEQEGIEVIRADLLSQGALAGLPDAPNVIYLAGHKFGTTSAPGLTWMTNTVLPALVAERYRASRIAALSTGNVYPLVPAASGGSRETDPPGPVGEYAWTCVGRERLLEQAAVGAGTRIAIIRLNYAVDLRYGVLVDIAQRVRSGSPVDISVGWVNVIWQGDAIAQAIRSLAHAASPARAINVTGPECLRVRDVAVAYGERFNRAAILSGIEGPDALLSDTTLARELLGAPRVNAATLITWVGDWLDAGGRTLGKPTGFEQREGRF